MCGGGPPKLPFRLSRWLYAVPYGLLGGSVGIVQGILSYLGASLGKRTGHGRGISLLDPVTGEPEKLEFLISWTRKYLNDYWYQVLILSLTGLATTLIAGVVVCLVNPVIGTLVILSGAIGKPLAYMIGWSIYPKGKGKGIPQLNEATAIGEFLTGVFGGLPLVYSLLYLLGLT